MKKRFKCEICSETFNTSTRKQNHKRKHFPDRVYKCDKCPRVYSALKFSSYYAHRRTHASEKPHKCTVCGKGFHENNNLKRHMRSHTGERPFPCLICKNRFACKSGLSNHMRIHSNRKDSRFHCLFCGSYSTSKPHFYSHLLRHIKEKAKHCSFCDVSYVTTFELTQHIALEHTLKPTFNPVAFGCVMCSKSFPTNGQLMSHIKRHTREKPNNCTKCEKSYTSKGELTMHFRMKHTNNRPHECNICGERFHYQFPLDQHIRRHLGEKTYKCKICDRAFAASEDLKRHEQLHDRSGTHDLCVFCGKFFRSSNKSSYYIHLRSHIREKACFCKECGKEYALPAKLQVHSRLHSGMIKSIDDEPYQCW
ncbi:unnamed protein product [Orchesella dallaii]|uniref:C2H2-type domain-containing protein n=1 Tax=Orchesella dallaii TaxID=48710 RepID=A0ABP1QHC8_9HEXA